MYKIEHFPGNLNCKIEHFPGNLNCKKTINELISRDVKSYEIQ